MSARPGAWALALAGLLVVAAAAILLYMAKRDSVPAPPPVPAGTSLAGPEARFTWRRDPRADVYRIEAYDDERRLLAAAVLRDTSILASVLLPDTAKSGAWHVVPVGPGGSELPPGALIHFHR